MKNMTMKLVELPIFGKKILTWITNIEGGLQESTFLRKYTRLKRNVNVGLYTYGGCFDVRFNIGGTVEIGNYCSFSTDIHYFGGNHPMDYASMSPYFYKKSFGYDVKDIPREALCVGHDVWCGYGVKITSKCHNIGNGAVIAAGSVVTLDVPAYAVVAGSPARVIRYRFDIDTIEALEKSKWYQYSPEQLIKFYGLISKPIEFANAVLDEFDRDN